MDGSGQSKTGFVSTLDSRLLLSQSINLNIVPDKRQKINLQQRTKVKQDPFHCVVPIFTILKVKQSKK